MSPAKQNGLDSREAGPVKTLSKHASDFIALSMRFAAAVVLALGALL